MGATPARPGAIRWVSLGAFAAWVLLFVLSYGYVPGLKHAWGLNLLRYLQDWQAWLLTGLALLVTTDEARRGLLTVTRWVRAGASRLPPRLRDPLLFVAALGCLWGVHERVVLGDSTLLHSLLGQEAFARYPKPGGLTLLDAVYRLAHALGLPALGAARLLTCAAGAVAVVFVVRAARLAGPEGGAAPAVAPLTFSAGLAAASAGRLEIQPLVLAASAVYLWLALRFLREGSGLPVTAFALGVAVWIQPWCLLLAPGLLVLPRLRGQRASVPALGLVLVPFALHVLVLLAWNPRDLPAGTVLLRALGTAGSWVRLPGSGPSLGTDYVLFSHGHLKYLGNAAYVLAPAALPLLLGVLAVRRRAVFAAGPIRFLGVSTLGLAVAVCGIRPIWGPFDWDLFSVAALFALFLAGSALGLVSGARRRAHIAAAAVGLQLCFVGIPLLAIGQGAPVAAGPFVVGRFEPRLLHPGRHPPKRIAPWL